MTKDEKQLKLDNLKKRCFIFLDFFYEKYGQLEMYKTVKVAVEKEYQNGNLKVLTHTSKDFNNWLREMPYKDALELGSILKKELNEDIALIEKKRLDFIKSVVKKRKIKDDEDYRIIEQHVSDLSQEKGHDEEIEKLNEALLEYEHKKQAK